MAGTPDKPLPTTDTPLAGRSIVVTRTREQAGALVEPLEALGAEVLAFPVIELADPVDPTPLSAAVERVRSYDWLVLTSTNAVDRFLALLAAEPAVPGSSIAEKLEGVKTAAVGSATAARMQEAGIEPDLVPADFRAEGLVEAFSALETRAGCRVLVPRAAEARAVLPERLGAMGCEVDAVDLYRLVPPAAPDPTVLQRFSDGTVDVITFASGATARHFVELLESQAIDAGSVLDTALVASVGPVTSEGLRDLGVRVDIEARESTMSSLVDAIVERYR